MSNGRESPSTPHSRLREMARDIAEAADYVRPTNLTMADVLHKIANELLDAHVSENPEASSSLRGQVCPICESGHYYWLRSSGRCVNCGFTWSARIVKRVMDRDSISCTVWKDGAYKFWEPLSAAYAETDPDWLCNIALQLYEPTNTTISETREPIGLFWQTSDGKWHFSPGTTKRGDIHDNGRPIRIAYLGEEAT